MENVANQSKFSGFIEKYYKYIFIVLIAILCFACFFDLGGTVVYDWDEARHGVNAYEMIKNGNYIANFFNGEVDYYNLKPPLSYYFIILGYKIFGYNAWGLRFFSALFYMILSVCVALFLKNRYGKLSSLISILLFEGCYFYFFAHFVRAGDGDALFVLLIGLGIIFLLKSDENKNWLCATGFAFALAFLTKSWHAFILAPITLFYLIFTKGFKGIKWWQYITAFLSAIIPIAIWVVCRYSFDGWTFIQKMIEYDLIKRSGDALEGHSEPFFFYFYALYINVPLLLCFIASVIGIVIKFRRKIKLSSFDVMAIVSYLSVMLIYTIAKTKLNWYVFPLCVPMIISGAPYIAQGLDSAKRKIILRKLYIGFSVACYCATIICIILTFGNINQQNGKELQSFISQIEIPSQSEVYYQDSNSGAFCQSALLCLEWKTDNYGKKGGWQEFKTTSGSYLIVSKEYYDTATEKDNILIILKDNNYLLCYNNA